jgi:hypothetical protein
MAPSGTEVKRAIQAASGKSSRTGAAYSRIPQAMARKRLPASSFGPFFRSLE